MLSANPHKEKLIQIFLIGFIFFIPISTALMNLFLYLSLILIISNNFIQNIKTSWNNDAARYTTLFFLLVIVSLSWSIGSYEDIIEGLSAYKKFIFVALILPYAINHVKREALINTFLISMSLVLILVYLIFLNIIDPINIQLNKDISLHVSTNGGFKTHIITNVLFAFSGFLTMHRFFNTRKLIYLIIGILMFYYSILISSGTTGQILSISLLSVLILQRFKYKSILILPFILLTISIYGVNNSHTTLYNTINKITSGVDRYNKGTVTSSVDMRISMIVNGLIITKENPWIGVGIGSINQAHNDNFDKFPKGLRNRGDVTNPHSEFMSISIQFGVLGLILYLLYLYKLFECTKKLPNDFYKHSAQGLLVLILVGSLGSSLITDSGEGHFIMLFIAILFAPLSEKIKTSSNASYTN